MKRLALLITLALLCGCVATKTEPDFRDKHPHVLQTYRAYLGLPWAHTIHTRHCR